MKFVLLFVAYGCFASAMIWNLENKVTHLEQQLEQAQQELKLLRGGVEVELGKSSDNFTIENGRTIWATPKDKSPLVTKNLLR